MPDAPLRSELMVVVPALTAMLLVRTPLDESMYPSILNVRELAVRVPAASVTVPAVLAKTAASLFASVHTWSPVPFHQLEVVTLSQVPIPPPPAPARLPSHWTLTALALLLNAA